MSHLARTLLLLPPLLLAVPGSGHAADGATPAVCSPATLHGTYLFAFPGVTVVEGASIPYAVAGYEVYGGDGSMRSVVTSNIDGEVSHNVRQKGRYTVNADCTGTVEYADGTLYDLFVGPDGSNFVFVQTNPGKVAAGFEPRGSAQKVAE